ncbi:MAG TPA: ABC transporter ATP-binding protein [Burkholderiales bacterium]|jgi:ABC-2 type transport system ATP-binding protein|nr:ABC transporter ATP-binding protein [Burkholderiales bacterium]
MTPAIEVRDLVKRFDTVEAVRGLTFTVARGSTCALLGGNGAGKTTTLSMLLGVLLPSSGAITVLGEDIARHRYRVLGRMNFTSPYVDLPKKLTVEENLRMFARLYGVPDMKRRIRSLADELDLADLLDRAYGALSAGMRTRVSVAKALLNSPELLLLDEPTASLDPDVGDRVRTQLMDYRKRTGATLFLASHNMPEVERMCDTVLMMRAGRIVDTGSPAALIARYGRSTMEEVFLDVARRPERTVELGPGEMRLERE